jgi:osmotically-inducible protein OsmY
MRTYNQQIEDAYAGSKRQGDMMRDRNIERSSGQDRRNRYRDDQYQYPQRGSFEEHNQYEDQRTDRYGYERSSLYSNDRRQQRSSGNRDHYPETYRSAMGGYMSEHVGSDLGRNDYYQNPGRGNQYGPNEGPHRGRGPKNYQRSDERIREEIIDRLTDDPDVDASEIEVEVKSGEITLMGMVDERNSKRRAEDIAESVSGVTQVENRLKVQPANLSGDQRSENEIRSESTT